MQEFCTELLPTENLDLNSLMSAETVTVSGCPPRMILVTCWGRLKCFGSSSKSKEKIELNLLQSKLTRMLLETKITEQKFRATQNASQGFCTQLHQLSPWS